MPGLLGKKIGMTSVFSAEGKNLPCTVIEVHGRFFPSALKTDVIPIFFPNNPGISLIC